MQRRRAVCGVGGLQQRTIGVQGITHARKVTRLDGSQERLSPGCRRRSRRRRPLGFGGGLGLALGLLEVVDDLGRKLPRAEAQAAVVDDGVQEARLGVGLLAQAQVGDGQVEIGPGQQLGLAGRGGRLSHDGLEGWNGRFEVALFHLAHGSRQPFFGIAGGGGQAPGRRHDQGQREKQAETLHGRTPYQLVARVQGSFLTASQARSNSTLTVLPEETSTLRKTGL